MNWESLSTNEHRAGWKPSGNEAITTFPSLRVGGNLEQLQRLGALEHMLTGFYGHPLVNCTITMGKSPFLMGKSTINDHFQ